MEGVDVDEVAPNALTPADEIIDLEAFTYTLPSRGDFSKGLDHVNAIRRLGRLVTILERTYRANLSPNDYGCESTLIKFNTDNRGLFSDFLEKLANRECQIVILEFFKFVRWSREDAMIVMQHLTHFKCQEEKQKRKNPAAAVLHAEMCMQRSPLTEWQSELLESYEGNQPADVANGDHQQEGGERPEVVEEETSSDVETEGEPEGEDDGGNAGVGAGADVGEEESDDGDRGLGEEEGSNPEVVDLMKALQSLQI